MVIYANNPRQIQILFLCSLISCVYMSVLIAALFYYNNLYAIGKRGCFPVIAGIIIVEFIKSVLLQQTQTTSSTRDKSNRTKVLIKNKVKNLGVILMVVIIYFSVAVLFGAPFLSEHEETFMFALLLTALTALPACLSVGGDATISILIGLTTSQNNLRHDLIRQNICLTLFGAWLAAIVIPLDWDRPWQVWPIPCSLGGMLGYLCFHFITTLKFIPKLLRLFVKKTGKYGL